MKGRLSTAGYEKGFSSILPIHPVSQVYRLTPQNRQQQNTPQQQNSSFASILHAKLQTEAADAHKFNAYV